MKAVHRLIPLAALALAAVVTLPVQAQTAPAAKPGAADAQAALTEGEVRKVDKENRKITLKHGAIKNLDMPPMTMVFQVTDVSLLDKVKVGDKVRFKAADDGGKYTVTELQPAR